jgi:hypothetical protein
VGAVLLIAATRRRSAVSSEETLGALDEVVASTGVSCPPFAAQCSDGIEQLAPMPQSRDASLLEVILDKGLDEILTVTEMTEILILLLAPKIRCDPTLSARQ